MLRSAGKCLLFAACVSILSATACSCSPDSGKPVAASSGGNSGTGGGGDGGGSGGAVGSGGSGSAMGGAGGGAIDVAASGGASGTGGGSGSGGAAADGGTLHPTTSALKLGAVATWRGGATAAYSIIHDDLCDEIVGGALKYAEPEQLARGIHGGYGVITSKCDDSEWARLKEVIAHGHDVFNHSTNHPCMTRNVTLAESCDPIAPLSDDFTTEIDSSTTTLKNKLGIPMDFFIFPYDVCDPAAVARLKTLNYLGARCGTGVPTTNTATFPDSFKLNFDVWGPAYSTYITDPKCAGVVQYVTTPDMAPAACRTLILQKLVDDSIAQKGWGIREVHGFVGDPMVWEALPLDEYKAHLDYVKAKMDAGELWAEGPTPVLRYRWARQYCAAPILTASTLKFGAPSADCSRYATVLTYFMTTTDGSDPTTLKVQQAGKTLPVRRLAKGSYAVDADPTKGDATVVQ